MLDSWAEVSMLVNRFQKGKIGEVFKKVMEKKELRMDFEKRLPEVKSIQEELQGNACELYQRLAGIEDLWESFQLNIIMNLFQQSVIIWYENEERNLDEIILSLITEENMQGFMNIFIDKKIFIGRILLEIQNGEIEIALPPELQSLLQEEEDSSTESFKKFVMPTNEKSSKHLN